MKRKKINENKENETKIFRQKQTKNVMIMMLKNMCNIDIRKKNYYDKKYEDPNLQTLKPLTFIVKIIQVNIQPKSL